MKRKSNDEFSFICGNESYNKVDVTVDQNCRASVKSITPTTIAISPDGKFAAIGGADELIGVIVFKLK